MQDPTDNLAPAGRQVLRLDPHAYESLVPTGGGSAEAKQLLAALTPDELVTPQSKNRHEAAAMLAGLWLWHDWLDESHRLSQNIETPSGSFWHAILHRREGDFSNGKYWYARCASHPTMQAMAANAPKLVNSFPADKALLRLVATGWNASAFVDLVEQVHQAPQDPRHALAVALQKLEWQLLFDHCTRAAATGGGLSLPVR